MRKRLETNYDRLKAFDEESGDLKEKLVDEIEHFFKSYNEAKGKKV